MRNRNSPARRIAANLPSLALTLAALLTSISAGGAPRAASAASPNARPAATAQAAPPPPMDSQQVILLLDQTIRWYRAQNVERGIAIGPADSLIQLQNTRTARQVLGLAFTIARADAQLIAKSGSGAAPGADPNAPGAGLFRLKSKLTGDQKGIDDELASARHDLTRARGAQRAALLAKISELQGERDLTDARIGLIDTMVEFIQADAGAGKGAKSLMMQIEAMALALPVDPKTVAAAPASAPPTSTSPAGLWQLGRNVIDMAARRSDIDARDRAASDLQNAFIRARAPLIARVKSLTARGDALAALADTADTATLNGMRTQLDALAAQYKQLAVVMIPFGKVNVLLMQYRANLRSWRAAADAQYRSALIALGIRLGMLSLALILIFVAAGFWKRAVYRYSHDSRRRHQLLLFRNITLWAVVVMIVGIAFASELGSVATLAGLITAGVAVAMQSVLVSIVGYFFLIGKYGIRIGDRVQIGDVTGEVIELGLVRMHLMELGGQGRLGPTGRVVAFANSIVFQVSSGLFKQIPGVDMAWHEVKLTLPADADPVAAKERLLAAVNEALHDYRDEIDRQAAEIQDATASKSGGKATPEVQLQFGAAAVEARVRYPVHLPHAAEIDERVSKELMRAVARP